jgi:predicted amidohydrolase
MTLCLSCVATAAEITTETPGVIVFPEYTPSREVVAAASRQPGSVIVAAIKESNRSLGLLLHRRRNRISYLKLGTDGRTTGTGDFRQFPMYELPFVCIGVVICMDIQEVAFWHPIAKQMMLSPARTKVLCIPADMGSQWFREDLLGDPMFEGIHVVLSNHTTNKQVRCRSFITDTGRMKIRQQVDRESIHLELP